MTIDEDEKTSKGTTNGEIKKSRDLQPSGNSLTTVASKILVLGLLCLLIYRVGGGDVRVQTLPLSTNEILSLPTVGPAQRAGEGELSSNGEAKRPIHNCLYSLNP